MDTTGVAARGTWVRRWALVLVLAAGTGMTLPAPAVAQDDDPVLDAIAQEKDAAQPAETRHSAGGSVRPPANAADNAPGAPGVPRAPTPEDAPSAAGEMALRAQGTSSDAALWGLVRHGETFTTQAPGPVANFLVQDAGMSWQRARAAAGALQTYGGGAILAVVVLLAAFYALRGRIRIEHGRAHRLIERFKPHERFGHWLLAGSFVLLTLTGLNLLYGKAYLMPVLGKETFATLAAAGKWVHNNVAWAFMLGLIFVFVKWVRHNIPSRLDLAWLAKGGGLFSKGVHPPSRKFNAGQKIVFWLTILLGVSVSASGLSLLLPYDLPMFAKTFAVLNALGADLVLGQALPTDLTPIQEMQYAQLWHSIVAFAMICVIIAHIYIGSVGMEGAFDAMGTGYVDRNWAVEHHSLWVEEKEAETDAAAGHARAPTPAAPAE